MKLNLEGRKCGACNKGKLRKFSEEVAPGLFVEAYKCDYAGHVSYPEKTMRAIEALQRQASKERHVVRVGNSLAVPIPSEMAKSLGLKPRRKVFVRSEEGEVVIRPSPA